MEEANTAMINAGYCISYNSVLGSLMIFLLGVVGLCLSVSLFDKGTH